MVADSESVDGGDANRRTAVVLRPGDCGRHGSAATDGEWAWASLLRSTIVNLVGRAHRARWAGMPLNPSELRRRALSPMSLESTLWIGSTAASSWQPSCARVRPCWHPHVPRQLPRAGASYTFRPDKARVGSSPLPCVFEHPACGCDPNRALSRPTAEGSPTSPHPRTTLRAQPGRQLDPHSCRTVGQ